MDYKKSYSIFNISLYVAVALCMVAMSTGLSFLAFVGLGLFALGGLQAHSSPLLRLFPSVKSS